MAVCPTCNTAYEASLRICPKDGTALPAEPVIDPNLGSMLEGKYRIDSFISAGGMGSVYRGTHVMLDKTVAIKLIRRELVTAPDIGTRFQREARAASNLGHPNIAAVSDFGQTADGTLYLVMEYIKGASLREVIQQGGPMTPDRVIAILQPIASALARAHRQHIIHRDLKPHNIMLDVDADGVATPKLLDFGIAKTFDEATGQLTMTGFALGTPQYMSPEQATGKQVDGRSDIYSLGVVLYEMLIGEVPFSDTSLAGVLLKHMTEAPIAPSVRRPDLAISPALEAIAMRCLEKEQADRFQTAEDLFSAFEQARTAPATEAQTLHMGMPASAPVADATLAMPRTPGDPPRGMPVPPVLAGASNHHTPSSLPLPLPQMAAKGTSPTIAAPPASVPSTPNAPTRKSTGAIWIPVAAIAALILLAVGVRGLRQPDSPEAQESATAAALQTPEPAPTATTPAANTATTVPDPPAATAASGTAPSLAVADPAPVVQPTSQTPTGGSTATIAPAGATTRAPSRPQATTALVPLTATQGAQAGGTAPGSPATAPRPQPAAPPVPENPSVFLQCNGPGEICGPMRAAFADALVQDHMTTASSPARADVVLSVAVEIVEERAERSFGSTFVTRTYSAEVDGDARGAVVPMPQGRTFSFDARVGRERANENSRLLASDTVDKVREYWARQR